MARTPSTMRPLGAPAPDFALPDTEGAIVTRDALLRGAPDLLVMFICNHCPFVVHLRAALGELTSELLARGLPVVAINSNDAQAYPADAPPAMAVEKVRAGYAFPYLFDATQAVAHAYGAACTPDFFLFDAQGLLVYRGQFDASRPGNDVPVTGADLRAACDALLAGRPIPADQRPSLGCNIKWRPGHAPSHA